MSLASMKVVELRAELKKRGLPTSGRKALLIERLEEAMAAADPTPKKSARKASAKKQSARKPSPAPSPRRSSPSPSPKRATPKRATPKPSTPKRVASPAPARKSPAKVASSSNDKSDDLAFNAMVLSLIISGLSLVPVLVLVATDGVTYLTSEGITKSPLFADLKGDQLYTYLALQAVFAIVRVAAGLDLSASRNKVLYAVALLSHFANAYITASIMDTAGLPKVGEFKWEPFYLNAIMSGWMLLGAPYYLN